MNGNRKRNYHTLRRVHGISEIRGDSETPESKRVRFSDDGDDSGEIPNPTANTDGSEPSIDQGDVPELPGATDGEQETETQETGDTADTSEEGKDATTSPEDPKEGDSNENPVPEGVEQISDSESEKESTECVCTEDSRSSDSKEEASNTEQTSESQV